MLKVFSNNLMIKWLKELLPHIYWVYTLTFRGYWPYSKVSFSNLVGIVSQLPNDIEQTIVDMAFVN